MWEQIFQIVREAIEEFNAIYKQNIPIELGEEAPLYGGSGVLDSLGLVSLIVMIEQSIEDELGVPVILADEKAMSQKNSPFLNVHLLVVYIVGIIEEEKAAWSNPSP